MILNYQKENWEKWQNKKTANRLISNNKKAYFDYFIEDKYEAGLVLHGTEVNLSAWENALLRRRIIQIQNGEVFINNMNITPYEKGNIFNKDPTPPEKAIYCTRAKSTSLPDRLRRKDIQLCHCRFI